MPPSLASASTPKQSLSDFHKRRLEVFVDIPPSPAISARMTPRNTVQSTVKATPSSSRPTTSKPTPNSLKRKHDVFVEIPPSPLHRTTPRNGNNSTRPGSSKPSSVRRRSQVYVDIPASPISIARMMKGTLNLNNNGMKASPLSTKAFNANTSAGSPMKKRKLCETTKLITKGATESNPFPNGHFHCHQCRRKLDNFHGLHCTVLFKRRCRAKYCNACLRNRYGQDADAIKRRAAIVNGGHVSDEAYQWMCPKCSDTCNCVACRKAKGLPALGKLRAPPPLVIPGIPIQAKFSNGGSVGIMPYCDAKPAETEKQPKPRAPRIKKPVREPKWVAVPTGLSHPHAEDRFFLREFILRFSPLMKGISGTCLEDLDLFHRLGRQSAKALINGLLDLIAADAEVEEAKMIRETLKKTISAGTSPAALWARLHLLCDKLPEYFFIVPIPDPGPRPSYAEDDSDEEAEPVPQRRIKTRGAARKTPEEEEILELDNGVTHALQLLPCIIALCECALQGPSVRAEIEAGAADARGENRLYFAEVRKENERWAKERSSLGWGEDKDDDDDDGKSAIDKSVVDKKGKKKEKEKDAEKSKAYKEALTKHKSKLASLENAHFLELQSAAPRFGPLGRDSQGRVYYAASVYRRKDKRCKQRIPDEEDRTDLKKWGWFLAVWGRGGIAASTSKENKEEGWWGFSDPAEIRQLAKWLAALEGVDGKDSVVEGPRGVPVHIKGRVDFFKKNKNESGDVFALGPPTEAQAKGLVKGLNDYADLLEWRLNGGEAQS